jgi:glycosyltransferase involved in cell wall biosynthesis
MTLTVAIISGTKDIPIQTMKSVSFADEIIVIIDGKQDKKPFINGKIKFFNHPLNYDFATQRNYALSKSKSEWILFVDTDEYVSKELALEIRQVIKTKKVKAFLIPRKDVVFYDVLGFGETGKIKILRLAQKNAGKFTRSVHETWQIAGPIGHIQAPLYHHKDHFVSEFSDRIANYGPLDAKELESEKKPFSYFRLIFFPKAKFIQNYIFRLGFMDGTSGLFLAYLLAIQSLSVRIFQWTKRS